MPVLRKLDRSRDFSICCGHPLTHAYEQDGIGFDETGKPIGRIDYAANKLIAFNRGEEPIDPSPQPAADAGVPESIAELRAANRSLADQLLEVTQQLAQLTAMVRPAAASGPAPAAAQAEPAGVQAPEAPEIFPDLNGNFIKLRADLKKLTGVVVKNKREARALIKAHNIQVANA